MLTPSCICNMSIDMVIWYDKCVYGTIQIIAAAALHVKNGISETALYLGQFCQPGLWLIEADGRCGQMSMEYDQVRLAAMGI